MKKKFSTKWKASKKPRKQRKYVAKAPLHIKHKLMSVNLAKDLRKKHGRRNIEIRKDDKAKIMRGKFKGKSGKILIVNKKLQKVFVEGIQTKKQDGSKANVPVKPSNLQIIELNLNDKKRLKSGKVKNKTSKKPEEKKTKEVKKQDSKDKVKEDKK